MTTPVRLEDVLAEIERLGEENAELLARLAAAETRFRLVARGVLRLQEAERGRISRELHDGVGQSLTAVKLQLALLEKEAREEGVAERLHALCEVADQALQEVRQLSHLLRPQMLDELGLVPTLRWLARTVTAGSALEVELQHDELDGRLDPEMETLVFRFVQEALNNAAKHAPGAHVRVEIGAEPRRLRLRVSDDGPGFDARRAFEGDDSGGFGLRGLRERVLLFGGRFDVQSQAGRGTTLEATVPLAGGREEGA